MTQIRKSKSKILNVYNSSSNCSNNHCDKYNHHSCGCSKANSHNHSNSCECSKDFSNINNNYYTKEFILKGLNCTNCANKIERNIRKLDGITNSSLNFSTSRLKVEFEKKLESTIYEIINKIVTNLEPDVDVIDTSIVLNNDHSTKEFTLKGLNCTNCANKIERNIKNLDGVINSSLNFSTSKLKVEFEKKLESTIYETITKIVTNLEPDVKVIDTISNLNKSNSYNNKKNKNNINTLPIKMILTLAFMGLGFLFKKESFGFIPFLIGYFIISFSIMKKSIKNIIKGEIFDENFLMVIATLAAISVAEYPEAIMVMLLYQVGEYFQGRAVESSRKSISDLMDIRPDYANLKSNNKIKKVSPNKVSVGDIIIVKPGEKVPLDGIVIEGNSSVDTKALTGESIPKEVSKNTSITSGFINIDGLLTIRVTKTFGESAVSKILDLVQNATSKKAKTELRITKFAKYYTPIVVLIAVLLTIIPPIFIPSQTFNTWLIRGATFLVVSCPCALVISIPMSYFAGLGASSKSGVLVKGGNYLEALNNVGTLVFDKTGTLTKGNFKVDKIVSSNDFNKDDFLKYVAHVESFSTHPIAVSIVSEFNGTINKDLIKNYKEIRGKGVEALVDGKLVSSGNLKFLRDKGITVAESDAFGTVIYTAIDNKYIGFISIKDEIKEDSKKAILGFKKLDINNIVMLTGDRKITAVNVSKELSISNYKYGLLPNEKVSEVENLIKNKGNKSLVFVGDGINDAPVLARADVGIAMGGVGSDAAIEAADVVIMNDAPSKIINAIKIAKKTKRIANENIFMSILVKLIIMVLALFGLAPMWLAIFGDVGVSIIAVFNAMRILKIN
ncbi:heavy metal translocating P-type ATPase [Clostridium oceanicum]|uniref:Cd(2+)-exporting ATPase n=1 Tax=Clostridium oceanicum TaxID=1543 RepID=A0ABP3UQT4_9CLOT